MLLFHLAANVSGVWAHIASSGFQRSGKKTAPISLSQKPNLFLAGPVPAFLWKREPARLETGA
ncbi:hypothetical protein RNZ42_11805 [Lacticaseibacillus paracasei]|uniref:Uncharacterized protein n=1 Tax=Lacticaseibacillus paracasei subsp. paracasei Lpp126 TaxID=1256206 RepID=S2T4L9_LACPA|nr:hypothetical protein [Lacticaseibacillus paracasei]EPC86563.1 hypothetical protein Lpp126_02507 [Lacticaseibacillus paracasei subsp. paracasei Lpp126]WQG46613.1 hypothetical protein U2Q69_10870 [Lacticaseibacillus casei]TLQ36302.1 hypothetical protein FEZ40_06005 [Lacticaseibacillus paracasei]WNO50971.1 hypothetical protein RNZ42_11805 [Lacticaseibacillus paracasei]WPP10691.1 hypothetical protein SGY26_09160 [Lacticaseibacillus paracasei]